MQFGNGSVDAGRVGRGDGDGCAELERGFGDAVADSYALGVRK